MVESAHGLGVAAVRAGAGHFVKGQLGAGGDDQVVVTDGLAVRQLHLIGGGVNAVDALGDEVDALFGQIGRGGKAGVGPLAPADADPGIGGHELIGIALVDDGDVGVASQGIAQLVSARHAAQSRADDDDVCHNPVLCL